MEDLVLKLTVLDADKGYMSGLFRGGEGKGDMHSSFATCPFSFLGQTILQDTVTFFKSLCLLLECLPFVNACFWSVFLRACAAIFC